ncbi:MAG: hypothetical protein NXI10_05630 [bacterium]|nr:hypothetical protein [bacterium]
MKKHIPASSITEVVIAITVIAICIGISSMIFTRSMHVTTDFESVKMQTELQSDLWKQMVLNQQAEAEEPITVEEDNDLLNDSLKVLIFRGLNDRVLWQQHWLKNE